MPSGGVVFLHAQQPVADLLDSLDGDERTGARIIYRALEEPIRQIAQNAGADGSIVVDKVRTEGGNVGFNALSGEYEDLVSAGVTDPTMVSRSALQNAASIGSLIVTTDVIVAEPEEARHASRRNGWHDVRSSPEELLRAASRKGRRFSPFLFRLGLKRYILRRSRPPRDRE